MKVILIGATGLVGAEVLKLLLEDAAFTEVTVYARKPLPVTHDKLTLVQGELAALPAHREALQGDVYVSCLGTTIKTAGSRENFRKVDFHGVMSFARIAVSSRAKKFILVSSSGADARSRVFYSRVKGETEKALKDLALKSLVIFRPGLLIGEREEKRAGEKFAIGSFRVLRFFSPKTFSRKLGTPVEALARRILEEAKGEGAGTKIIPSAEI